MNKFEMTLMVHFNAARWFLFILFWLIWTGMLAAAVVIIVLAPKCPSPDPKVGFNRSRGIMHGRFSDPYFKVL